MVYFINPSLTDNVFGKLRRKKVTSEIKTNFSWGKFLEPKDSIHKEAKLIYFFIFFMTDFGKTEAVVRIIIHKN